ncbi:MAG: O-antigen ligase family protein, partial [Clostridia bacterium]|nr:O-antigen ligase family protein [Clostridia bacterium]
LKLRSNGYILWIILWAAVTGISLVYSINRSYTFTALLTIAARGAAFYMLICRIETVDQLISMLKIFVNVVTLNLFYILTKVDVAALGINRLGDKTIESDTIWNSNFIGCILAIAATVMIILIYTKQYQKTRKFFAVLQLLLFIIVILFCGSRTALFLLIGMPMLTYLFSSNIRNSVKRIIIIFIVLVLGYWIIMSVPQLYEVLGSRVERLFMGLEGKFVTDGSFNSRLKLIEYGIRWFKERPIQGYGMYTFMQLSSSYFEYAWYAHNNYIEVMVGTGIIGLIAYYWYYAYLLIESRAKNNRFKNVIIPVMIVVLFGEYGIVSFKSFAFQFVLCIVSILFNLGRVKTDDNESKENAE